MIITQAEHNAANHLFGALVALLCCLFEGIDRASMTKNDMMNPMLAKISNSGCLNLIHGYHFITGE
jgi:hypothetical protein